MEPFLVGILVPLGSFAMIFGIFYVIVTSRNRERMALIERGADPMLFESMKRNHPGRTMRLGIFWFGIGLGIVVAYFLASGGMEEGPAYTSMIFLFGGLSLILAHWLQRKQEKEDESKL